ncbi:hypothetical protein CRUP_012984 [Coryphaenoides rupestris]|nr:hypothetical protein CRUP_012984 [Coryphaenoides rupestris]
MSFVFGRLPATLLGSEQRRPNGHDCTHTRLCEERSQSHLLGCLPLSCPECAERLVPRQVADILQDGALLEKYEEFLLRRCLASDPDCRWCPAPDCG